MPLPLPDLDDRRFDDLVAEARARLQSHLPELTQIAPGDPVHALVDLFAWMTETVIYRANLIPERQRLAFLNLLQLPLRPAVPARGLVAIDSPRRSDLPAVLAAESLLRAGDVRFTTVGELQPAPLALAVVIKRELDAAALAAAGVTKKQLISLYGANPLAFQPTTLVPGRDPLSLDGSLDQAFYLALATPERLAERAAAIRENLAGITLNIGLAPADEIAGEIMPDPAQGIDQARTDPLRRQLEWDLAWQPGAGEGIEYLPLEVVDDSSDGGRKAGVARLRLPRDDRFLAAAFADDPQFAGFDDSPPEPPAEIGVERLLFWLRLRCPDEPKLTLGWIGINAVEVIGQGVVRDRMLGVGTGRPDQEIALPDADIDLSTLAVEVEAVNAFARWTQVAHFAASGPDDSVYTADAAAGVIRFGDGIRGRRPAANAGIRAAYYRYGGGAAGNLPAASIKELHGGSSRLKVRHEWPTKGGIDAESIGAAEQRIPAFLTHRDRAVTGADFEALARDNPVNPVARARAVPGFLPGTTLATARTDIPGVVSVFVLPPARPALGAAPQPSAGLLKDVWRWLDARTLIGTELYVLSPQFRPISLALALEVIDPRTERQVIRAVETALVEYLWALAPGGPAGTGWPLGRAVELNELRTIAGRVDGIESVNQAALYHQDLTTNAWLALDTTTSDDLPLFDYQLPLLMAMNIEVGEAAPAPPRGYGPSAGGDDDIGNGVPVAVIPDLC